MTRDEAIRQGLIKPREIGAPTPEPERRDAPVFALPPHERERFEREAKASMRRPRTP